MSGTDDERWRRAIRAPDESAGTGSWPPPDPTTMAVEPADWPPPPMDEPSAPVQASPSAPVVEATGSWAPPTVAFSHDDVAIASTNGRPPAAPWPAPLPAPSPRVSSAHAGDPSDADGIGPVGANADGIGPVGVDADDARRPRVSARTWIATAVVAGLVTVTAVALLGGDDDDGRSTIDRSPIDASTTPDDGSSVADMLVERSDRSSPATSSPAPTVTAVATSTSGRQRSAPPEPVTANGAAATSLPSAGPDRASDPTVGTVIVPGPDADPADGAADPPSSADTPATGADPGGAPVPGTDAEPATPPRPAPADDPVPPPDPAPAPAPDPVTTPPVDAAPSSSPTGIPIAEDGFVQIEDDRYPILRTCVTAPRADLTVTSYTYDEGGVIGMVERYVDGASQTAGFGSAGYALEDYGDDGFGLVVDFGDDRFAVSVNPRAAPTDGCAGRITLTDPDDPGVTVRTGIVDVCFGDISASEVDANGEVSVFIDAGYEAQTTEFGRFIARPDGGTAALEYISPQTRFVGSDPDGSISESAANVTIAGTVTADAGGPSAGSRRIEATIDATAVGTCGGFG